MALSVQQQRTGPDWPLGFIGPANIGTPVNIMSLVDPNNYNSPNSQSNVNTSEYTPRCKQINFQAYHPGNNNNGMVPNTGYIYVVVPRQGNGTGNRSDSGSMVLIVPPGGGNYSLPTSLADRDTEFSPYRYSVDADVSGEGALVTLIGMRGQ
jgi:hypothetical protein